MEEAVCKGLSSGASVNKGLPSEYSANLYLIWRTQEDSNL